MGISGHPQPPACWLAERKSMAGEDERIAWRRAVLEQIQADELVDLTRGLQQFRSFSGQEREAAEYYGAWLEAAGFEVRLPEAEPGRPNVVGILRGDGSGPSLMFNGHTDIDPLRG